MVDPAIFRYTGTYLYDYISKRRKDKITKLAGEVRQDRKKKKSYKTWLNCKSNKHYFSIAVPNKSGSFWYYYGNFEDKACRKYSRYSPADYVGSDMKRYSLQKMYVDEYNTTHQKWYYKHGDYEGQYWDKFWEVIVDERNGYIMPTKFMENFLASEDNTHTTHKVLHYNVSLPTVGTNTDDWFQIPDFC